MLTRGRNSLGFTVIELMISLAVFAVLVTVGLPMFFAWIQSSQIRTSAESILDGLALARAEAVHQNKSVSFQFVTSLTGSCAVSASGKNWVVSRDDPSGKCDQPPSDTVAPRIVQKRAANDGSPNAVVAADRATITFNGVGQATNLVASPTSITITNPTGGACATAGGGGGPMRCMRIDVTTAGQVRMCDPVRSSSDPQAC